MSRDDRLPAISPALANIVAKLSEDLKEGEDPLYWDVNRFGKRDEPRLLPDQAEVYEAPVTPPIGQPTPAGETQTVRLNVEGAGAGLGGGEPSAVESSRENPRGAAANLPTLRLPRRSGSRRASVLALGVRHPGLRLFFYKARARRWLLAGAIVLILGVIAIASWTQRAAPVGVVHGGAQLPAVPSAPPNPPAVQAPATVAPSAQTTAEFPPYPVADETRRGAPSNQPVADPQTSPLLRKPRVQPASGSGRAGTPSGGGNDAPASVGGAAHRKRLFD